jgi:hypothetical protein
MMKSYTTYIFCTLLIACCLSCEKDSNHDYCVNRIRHSTSSTSLTPEELNTVEYLFEKNHIDHDNYLFYRFVTDEGGHHYVGCSQIINHQMVFTNTLNFCFDENDNYYYLSGTKVNKIHLDALPHTNQNAVIEKFLGEIAKDGFYESSLEEIKGGCFDLEFGYYDLNAGTNSTSMNFIKVWMVTTHGYDYPIAYIDDTKGTTLYYDNGIRYK